MVVIEELPSEPRREANEPAKAAKKKTKKEVDEEKEKIVKAAAKRLANKHFQEQARLKERFRRLMGETLQILRHVSSLRGHLRP